MHYVTYHGPASGYLLILTRKKRTMMEPSEPVAVLYVRKDERLAVSVADFEILMEQGHIGRDKLEEG